MSKVKDLYMDIVDLLEQDYTGCEVAEMLGIDVDFVYDVMDVEESKNETV